MVIASLCVWKSVYAGTLSKSETRASCVSCPGAGMQRDIGSHKDVLLVHGPELLRVEFTLTLKPYPNP